MKITELFKKYSKLFFQFFKFGIVGVSNTLISLGTYYLLVFLGVHYLIANTAGFLLSVVNAYIWNSKYVFKEKTEESSARAFSKVFMSYLLSFCLSSVLIWLFVQVMNISEYLAPILRLVATIPLNFFMNKLWAFKEKIK